MARGTVYEGKTFDEAVQKGLQLLGIGRAEATITIIEEGSKGFLGFGARPFRVSVTRRPGGPVRDTAEHEPRRVSGTRRGGRDRDRDRGRGGERKERGDRDRADKPAPARAASREEPKREGRRERGRGRDRDREPRRDREASPAVAGVEASREEPKRETPRREERGRGRDRDRSAPMRADRPADARREREPEPEMEPAATAAPIEGEQNGSAEDANRKRRRRGRRGGRRRKKGLGLAGEAVAAGERMPANASTDAYDDDGDDDDAEMAAPRAVPALESAGEAPIEAERAADAEVAPARYTAAPEHGSRRRPERRPRRESVLADSEGGPVMTSEDLASTARQVTEDLLKAMGFEARISVKVDGTHADVMVEVDRDDDLLTGHKGETRQALQQLLNRFVNRGEGSRYHVQLEINDFWKRREDELVALAKSMADDAASRREELLTEFLNSQERRIVHMTLKEDSRVRTFALGTGMVKRVAIAPADFPERSGEEDHGS